MKISLTVHGPTTRSLCGFDPGQRYFLGQSASLIGDGTVAVVYAFAALEITGSGWAMPAVLLGLWMARTIFISYGGRAADRGNAARIMIAADVVRLASQLFTAVVFAVGEPQVWELVLAAAMYGAATAYFVPASITLLPQLVERDRLQLVNSRLGVVRNVGLLCGPAIGGGLYAVGGVPLALSVDVATFAISVCVLATLVGVVRSAPTSSGKDDDDNGDEDDVSLLGAFGVLKRYPVIAWIVAVWSAVQIGVASINVLGPLIARDDLGAVERWSALAISMALGGLAGSALAGYVRSTQPTRLILLLLATAMPAQLLCAAWWPHLVPLMVLIALTSVALAVCGVLFDTYLQTRIPADRLGRVSSAESGLTSAMIPVGFAISLPLAELTSRTAFLTGVSVLIVAIAAAAFVITRGGPRAVPIPQEEQR